MYFNYDIVVNNGLKKLLATRFIQTIYQITWLFFIMMVSKKNKKLRISINFYKFNFPIKKDPISFSIYQISPKCNNRPWNLLFSRWIFRLPSNYDSLENMCKFYFYQLGQNFCLNHHTIWFKECSTKIPKNY
jgi:hypothetical protein